MLLLVTSIFGGTVGLLFMLVWGLLSLIALISIFGKRGMYLSSRLLWILIVLAVPIGGALLYLSWRHERQL